MERICVQNHWRKRQTRFPNETGCAHQRYVFQNYELYSACLPINLFFKINFYFIGRVRLLLSKGHSCYRPRRTGERKRKSVRGCIVDSNLSVLSLVILRKGEQVSDK